MMTINTAVLRDLAAVLRQHGGQAVTRLGYAKGDWQLGRDKLRVNGTQWTARPDWLVRGWMFWWDGRILAYKIGYAIDGYVPPDRSELGYHDRDQWDVWCKGRDPWQHGWSLPLYGPVSGEEVLYSTDTMGGQSCLSILLQAFCDRVDSNPADNKILPTVELNSSSYRHPERGEIKVPVLDIVGWATPPNKPRPPLPAADPSALPEDKSHRQAIEGPRTSLTKDLDLDDAIPF
jgi:hypothetical protein